MSRIRVLVTDDAVVIRKLVTDALAADPEIEVVGTAANGRICLQKIPACAPDIVTLDVEMPEMDGLAAMKEIRRTYPSLPVIMFSTLTARGAETTLDALTAGASDYVTKPANVGGITQGLDAVRQQLIPKIKHLVRRRKGLTPPPPVSSLERLLAAGRKPVPPRIVLVGVSTGGPNALAALLPAIAGTLAAPMLIVQHMPPMFTRLLADRLNAQSALTVVEAAAGMAIKPGWVYLAPGDFHMVLERRGFEHVIQLTQGPPENSCRPAVDVTFRSVVPHFGSATLGVILTGMGQDGLRGCEDIRQVGGQILAQDEASSVVWGMPGFVAKAGLADRILPLDQMALEISRRVAMGAAPPATPTLSFTPVRPRVGLEAL